MFWLLGSSCGISTLIAATSSIRFAPHSVSDCDVLVATGLEDKVRADQLTVDRGRAPNTRVGSSTAVGFVLSSF